MLLYYIRHGDPIYNPDSLTPLGERQAEALSKRLAVYGLDEIYSSPSVRAKLTAKPTCEVLKKEPVILDWCLESLAFAQMSIEYAPGKRTWCFVDKETRKLLISPEVRALGSKWYTHPCFEGQKFAEGVARVEDETDKLMLSLGYKNDRERGYYTCEAPNNKRIALFAHEGFGKSFLSAILNIPYNELCTRFEFGHSGMTFIECAEEDGICIPRVLQHSNDSHLYREGLGTRYHNRVPI